MTEIGWKVGAEVTKITFKIKWTISFGKSTCFPSHSNNRCVSRFAIHVRSCLCLQNRGTFYWVCSFALWMEIKSGNTICKQYSVPPPLISRFNVVPSFWKAFQWIKCKSDTYKDSPLISSHGCHIIAMRSIPVVRIDKRHAKSEEAQTQAHT